MIANDRQYKITKSQLEDFKTSLYEMSSIMDYGTEIHPDLIQYNIKAIEHQIDVLSNEIHEYELLKEGKILVAEVNTLGDLPISLIKARIAKSLTQAQLAEQLGVKAQQIQRYEAELYETASLKTLFKIADLLHLKISGEIQIKEVVDDSNIDINKYPFSQMFKKGWFGNFSGNYNDALLNASELITRLFEKAGMDNLSMAFNRQAPRLTSNYNEFALKAWYAKVIESAKNQDLPTRFTNDTITESWIQNLRELSVDPEGPLLAVKFLVDSGIHIIIESHLEGTLLDGAALLMIDGIDSIPIIALTLRHDRLDNFWFVLFHEIAHLKLHLSHDITAIFDNLDIETEGIEKEADAFALNALIPNEIWKKSLLRFGPTANGIRSLAKSLKIHPALIAGRIRRETNKYFEFNDLVGQGDVRRLFINF